MDSSAWGNPIDVPNDDLEQFYSKQIGLEKEENERAILIKSFHYPLKNKLKKDFLPGKSKKIMTISSLNSNQKQNRYHQQQINIDYGVDCSLVGNYNFIENSSSVHSRNCTKKRKIHKSAKNVNEDKQSNTLKAVKKSGLVNTKINIYEKNLNNANDSYKELYNSKQKKAVFGVPLIGMHDTDPITTSSSSSWKNYGSKDPLQLFISSNKTVHPSKFPSNGNSHKKRTRTGTKRKAPSLPNSSVHSKAYIQGTVTSRKKNKTTNGFKKSSINSSVSYPVKFTKNPYFTIKDGPLKCRRDISQFQTTHMSSATMRPYSAFVRSSSTNGKRRTLYAKDTDRDETIRVLTNLCLNPLARSNKRASFMMW